MTAWRLSLLVLVWVMLTAAVAPVRIDAAPAKGPSTSGDQLAAANVPLPTRVPSWNSPELERVIRSALSGSRGTYGVAVKNLLTGERALYNAEEQIEAASLYKLPVLYEAFRQERLGAFDFDEKLTVSEHAATGYEDGEPTWPAGTEVLARVVVKRMIVYSDNTAAHVLLERLGVSQINRTARSLGLTQTEIWYGERTSALDIAELLQVLATGAAFDELASRQMLQLLLEQVLADRIPRYLPDGVRVANKTGELPGVRHDAGIVYAPNGPYVIVALAADLPDEQEGTETIAELSRQVYRYFHRRT
ncbi:MAG: serine hydrolase [Chloroflexi bacterium]|nr:serine hydrolase [Chloroflexota bacterium]